ncbi:MAG TPA: hypothetical protein PLH19_15705 [Anaerolineae bacterium]|nr:hypothetical protein [Anaerolineae bacterium]HQH39958.1 hypothetical protein [Anaerolineae bacterium]
MTDGSGPSVEDQREVDFPLAVENTWVYSGTFYQGFNQSGVLTATYIVTETVVDILHSELRPYPVFQIARYEELKSCPEEWREIPENWCDRLASQEPDYYWYAIDGQTIYQQQRMEIYRLPERGIRELVFPLFEGAQWYLTAEMAEAYPHDEVDSMLRKVEQENPQDVPAGDFEECYRMTEVIGGNWDATWYCPGVGIVKRVTDHSGTPFGSREILIGYKFSQ